MQGVRTYDVQSLRFCIPYGGIDRIRFIGTLSTFGTGPEVPPQIIYAKIANYRDSTSFISKSFGQFLPVR